MHVVRAPPVLGHDVAQRGRVAVDPRVVRPVEVSEVLLGDLHGFALVRHRDVDDAVGHLHAHRPDLVRREQSEPAAFDHGRAAHADVRSVGGDDHVAAPEDRGVAREAPAGHHTDERHQPAQLAEKAKGQAVEAGDSRAVRVTRPAAAAFGEEHDRRAQLRGQLEQPVLLAMVLQALRAREHRVVVGHHDRRPPVDRRQTADQTVRRRLRDQLVDGPPPTLRGDHRRSVLDQAAGIDQVGDVLPRRPLPGLAPPRHGVVPLLVEPGFVTRDATQPVPPAGDHPRLRTGVWSAPLLARSTHQLERAYRWCGCWWWRSEGRPVRHPRRRCRRPARRPLRQPHRVLRQRRAPSSSTRAQPRHPRRAPRRPRSPRPTRRRPASGRPH